MGLYISTEMLPSCIGSKPWVLIDVCTFYSSIDPVSHVQELRMLPINCSLSRNEPLVLIFNGARVIKGSDWPMINFTRWRVSQLRSTAITEWCGGIYGKCLVVHSNAEMFLLIFMYNVRRVSTELWCEDCNSSGLWVKVINRFKWALDAIMFLSC